MAAVELPENPHTRTAVVDASQANLWVAERRLAEAGERSPQVELLVAVLSGQLNADQTQFRPSAKPIDRAWM